MFKVIDNYKNSKKIVLVTNNEEAAVSKKREVEDYYFAQYGILAEVFILPS